MYRRRILVVFVVVALFFVLFFVTFLYSFVLGEGVSGYSVVGERRFLGFVGGFGVFNGWFISLRDGSVVAVNVGSGEERVLGNLASFGLVGPVRFFRSPGFFGLFDGRSVALWNGSLMNVGRFSVNRLSGVEVLFDGSLVVWDNSTVYVFGGPGYVRPGVYDVWSYVYRLLNSSSVPSSSIYVVNGSFHYTVRDVVLAKVINSLGGVVLNETVSYKVPIPVSATGDEARNVLKVNVVGVGVVDGVVHVAVNFIAPLVVNGSAFVRLQNGTVVHVVSSSNVVGVGGFHISLVPGLGDVRFLGGYPFIEVARGWRVFAFVYVPALNQSLSYRVVHVVNSSGEFEFGISVGSPTDLLRFTDRFMLIKAGDVVFIYSLDGRLVKSFVSVSDVDVDEVDGMVGFGYEVDGLKVAEFGVVDVFSGVVDKLVSVRNASLVGVTHEYDMLYFVFYSNGTVFVDYATRSPVAVVRLSFVDGYGNPVMVEGVVRVNRFGFDLVFDFRGYDVEFRVPVSSSVWFRVVGVFLNGEGVIAVTSPGFVNYRVVMRSFVLGDASIIRSSGQPFVSYVVSDESYISKSVLPPGDVVSVWRNYLAVFSGNVVNVYKYINGSLTKAWSGNVFGVSSVRIVDGYLIAWGTRDFYVFSIEGRFSVGGRFPSIDGFDLDGQYAVVWSRNSSIVGVINLLDGSLRYLNAGVFGFLEGAQVVSGNVVLYVREGNNIVMHVFDCLSLKEIVSYRTGYISVSGLVTDGNFHGVLFKDSNSSILYVVSRFNGVTSVRLPYSDARLLWIMDAGEKPPISGDLRFIGSRLSVVGIGTSNGIFVYGVAGNNTVLMSAPSGDVLVPAGSYLVDAPFNSSLLLLRDLSGGVWVTLKLRVAPVMVAGSDVMLVYLRSDGTFVIPNPTFLGGFSVSVTAVTSDMRPVVGSVVVRELGITSSINGSATVFLPRSGVYHLEVSGSYLEPTIVSVNVTRDNPNAFVFAVLKPMNYNLNIGVEDKFGPVNVGRVTIDGLTFNGVTVHKEFAVKNGKVFTFVLAGNYTLVFSSNMHESVSKVVNVASDTSVVLKTNRTSVLLTFLVREFKSNAPISGASIVINVKNETFVGKSNETGMFKLLVPINYVVNYNVSMEGYNLVRSSVLADADKQVSVTLHSICSINLSAVDESGRSISGTVIIYNDTAMVMRSSVPSTITLEEDNYTAIFTSTDGRSVQKNIACVAHVGTVDVKFIVPAKAVTTPAPLFAEPLMIGVTVVIVALAAFLIWRRIRKPGAPGAPPVEEEEEI
ncbi:MAG: hypothetical protein QW128_00705 [Thermoprotei archaeon]